MGSKVVIKRLYDYSIVLSTMYQLWDAVSEDGVKEYKPDLLNEIWLGLFVDDLYVGMYRFHSLTSILFEGHVFMLTDHRKHSLNCGYEVMKWLCKNTEFNKIIVNVPECFLNVIKFVEALGLKKQGYNSESYKKNGVILGMLQYGISRGDICHQR
jgi:hypothetical protein